MEALAKIQRVIRSNLLIKELCSIPSEGASDDDISAEETKTGFSFSVSHKIFLKKWNGLVLDIISFFGCNHTQGAIRNISKNQFDLSKQNLLIFASDPAGFLFGYSLKDESIYSIDSKGGEQRKVASNWDDFICNYLFGSRGKDFGGNSWLEELKNAGMLNDNIP